MRIGILSLLTLVFSWGLNAQEIPTVLVPGGGFQMGNPTGEKAEQPVHLVQVSSFRMAVTPVTVGQFRRFVEATGYVTTAEREGNGQVLQDLDGKGVHSPNFFAPSDASWKNPSYHHTDDFPVGMVGWFDAVEFCNWLSKAEDRRPVYRIEGSRVEADWSANGWRLPTEAEWEYAARGGPAQGPATLPPPKDLTFNGMTLYYVTTARPHPVGKGEPNSLGLFDIGGNVTEWCWDWYDLYPSATQSDPRGPSQGDFRVTRAGSWFQNWYQPVLQPTNRFYEDPTGDIFCYNGFRIIRNP